MIFFRINKVDAIYTFHTKPTKYYLIKAVILYILNLMFNKICFYLYLIINIFVDL